MTIDSAARPTARSPSGLRVLLLGGSALAMLTSGAVSAAGLPTQLTTDLSNVGAGSINTQVLNAGVATAGTVAYTTKSATGLTANVALTAPRTLIDWTSFDVTSGNTVNFNFAGSAADVVLNRVTGGAITVEAGGAVNGVFNGKTGGNIWFLADGGVFIHGTVTASGVLATRNTAVADLNLLSDNIATLKTELSAASSLIDMSGVVVASGADIDLNGNIVLSGDINTGAAGAVNLTSTGSVSQTAGAITAASLTGSSVGGASLPDANVFDSLTGFVNTAGGNVAINDASALTVTGAAINFDGAGDLTLTTKGALTLAAPVRAPVGTVALNAGGVIAQSSGFIQAVSLTGSSKGGATLTSATNAITNTLGVFANSGTGNIILTNTLFLNVVGPVTAPNGRFVLNAPTAVLPIQGYSDLSVVTEAGQPGSIVAQTLNGGVVATGTDNYTSNGTTATITLGAVPRTLIDWTSFTVGPTNTVNFKFTGTASDIVINRVTGGAITVDGVVNGHFGAGVGGGVWFLADGGVFLNGTVSASGILGGNNTSLTALALVQNDLSVLKTAFGSGGESLFDIEAVGTATASASHAQINIGGSIQLLGAVDAGASGSVVLASGQGIAQTSTSVIHAANLSGSATQSVILTGANQFDTLAGFTQNGVGQLTIIDAKTTGLTVSGAVSAGANNNLTLTSAGSLAINAPVTVGGAGAVSLNYKASAPTNLGFGDTGSVTFTNADGTAATTSQGGSLTINAQPYTLLYGLALGGSTGPDAGTEDLAGIDTNTAAGGDTGFYALATNLTGAGTAAAPQFTGALAGAGANSFTGVLEGLGHTVAGLTIGDTGVNTADAIGLIGANVGTVRDIGLVGGAVSGGEFTGSLVGFNSGSIVQVYASAAVSNAQNNGGAGGLVGSNSGAISQSYATGPVIGLQNVYTGGLVGLNAGAGTITQVYATGATTGGQFAGGLVGMNTGAVAQAYATGAVSGATGSAGGLIGNQFATGTVASSAYDTLTAGQGVGIGADQNKQQGNVAALTTAQLQGALPSGFDTAAWATGAGLYPFLSSAHPNGVQAVSGVAYTDMGVTPLASGANGAVLVNLTVNGLAEGAVATGANGYYYFALPAGAVGGTTPSLLLATIAANAVTGARNAAGLTSATGTTGGMNLYGGNLLFMTTATTYSTSGFPVAAPTALGFATTPGFVAGLKDFIQATGASFTIDAPIAQANGFGVQTTAASAPIIVSKDITLTGGSPLMLISSGGLAVNANLTTAAGPVTLVSGGAITGDTATITAGTLTGSSVGGASFTNKSNLIGTFGAFGDTGNGDVTVVDGQGLTVAGTVNIGSGTLTLTSTGAIAGDAAAITAGALTGSSAGGAAFKNAANVIGTFGAFKDTSNGNVTLADSQGLAVAGVVDIGSGTLTLASSGVISADAATITAGTLAGSSVGGASFNSSSNLIEAFELFTNTGGGDVVLKDRQALTVAGLTNKAGNVSLTTRGAGSNLTLDGDLTVGRSLTLASAGTVSQTSGAIIASNLTGSSTGGASVTGPNQITTLTGFTNRDAGAILLVNDIGLAVTGTIDNISGAPGGAGRDIGVTLTHGSLTGNGVFTAGRDVAIAAANGSLSFATATAGDDLVLRATAGVAVPGALTATGLASGSDAADTTATGDILVASGPIRVFGQAYQGLTDGSHIDVRTSGGDVTLGALAAATGDVRLQALAGSVHTANVSADRSIVIDAALSYDAGVAASNTLGAGGDVAVQTGSGPLAVGAVTAPGDILLTSAGGSVSLASASAGDDLLVRAGSDVLVAGALNSGTGSEVHGLADVFLANAPDKVTALFGHAYGDLTAGSAIDVVAGAGSVSLGDAAHARAGDIRLQALAGSIGYTSLTADGDVALNAVTAVNGGNVQAGGDLAIRGGDLSIGSVTAADDVVLRASGKLIATGTIASGTGAESFGAGDDLSKVSPLAIFDSPEPTLGGGVADIGAGGAVKVTGAITAGFNPTSAHIQPLSDIRIVSTNADSLSGPAIQALSALRASGDVALDAPNGGIAASGAIISGRDVAARAGVGALALISVSAGDDIVLGANTTIVVTGAFTGGTGGEAVGLGDTLAEAGPMTVFIPKTVQTYATDSDGSQIDVISGGDITIGGLASSPSDVRLQSISGAIHVVDITAGRDILLDAQTTVNAGAVTAAQDVAVSAAAGDLTLVSASAGDDIVARSGGATKVAGALTAGIVGEGRGAGDYLVQAVSMNAVGHQFAGMADGSTIDIVSQGGVVLGGAAMAPNGDVRLQSLGGAIRTTGIVAGRDIVIDAAANVTVGPTVTDTIGAGADIAILARSGGIALTSATAGGDVVLRAASGVIAVAGSLDSGTKSLGGYSGAGTYLTVSAPLRLFGVNETVLGEGSTDIGAQAVSVNGAIVADGAGAGVEIVTSAADIPGAPALHVFGAVTAGGDVALDSQGGSILVGGALAAAGDIAIWSEKSSVSLAQAQAGDDALIRAATTVGVTGNLGAGSAGESGGAADRLLAANPSQSITLFGQTQTGLADGSRVDVAAGSVSVGGTITASGTGSDVRIAAMGADPSNMTALSVVGPVNAGRDVALDAVAGSITLGGSTIAGRDAAARSLTGNIIMTSVMAGNDVVLSTPVGGVKLNGSVTASGAPTSPGPGPGKTLFDRVSAPLDGLFTLASGSIFIGAETYANAGYAGNPSANLTAATAIGLALADTKGLSLADANPNAGSWVKASALVAPTVTLFESKGPVSIGPAKLDSKVVSINIYDMAGVTVTGAFTPAANDTVALTIGAPDPATLNGATAANIAAAKDWTPSVIEVINDATTTNQRGSIGMISVNGSGVYSTTPVIFQKATLNATTNILLGTRAFVDANASVTDIAGLKRINPLLPVPIVSPNTSKAVMLAAGDLSLSAGRMIVQQNTTGLRTTEGTGYYVTRTLTLGSYLTNPPAIDLFGVFTKLGTTTPITGTSTAVSNQILLVGTLASSEFRSLYRVNGCVIGELGNCTPTSDGITSIPVDELGQSALLSRDELDVEDPTITGAPNEEIWRRPDDRP